MKPHKFGTLRGENSIPFAYPNLYAIEKTTGPDRLIIAPASKHVDHVLELTRQLPEPFGILYVLLVPRHSHWEPGRYQSPAPSSRSELEAFLNRFRAYFESDGRHHVWVVSLWRSFSFYRRGRHSAPESYATGDWSLSSSNTLGCRFTVFYFDSGR